MQLPGADGEQTWVQWHFAFVLENQNGHMHEAQQQELRTLSALQRQGRPVFLAVCVWTHTHRMHTTRWHQQHQLITLPSCCACIAVISSSCGWYSYGFGVDCVCECN